MRKMRSKAERRAAGRRAAETRKRRAYIKAHPELAQRVGEAQPMTEEDAQAVVRELVRQFGDEALPTGVRQWYRALGEGAVLAELSTPLAEKRAIQYEQAVKEAFELFQRKNAEYGDAISGCGVLGAAAELQGVGARLAAVMFHRVPTCAEELESAQLPSREQRDAMLHDKFLDAINYGAIGLMMMAEGNYTGR